MERILQEKMESDNAVKKRESCPADDKSKICNDSLVHLNYIPQSFNLKIQKVHS